MGKFNLLCGQINLLGGQMTTQFDSYLPPWYNDQHQIGDNHEVFLYPGSMQSHKCMHAYVDACNMIEHAYTFCKIMKKLQNLFLCHNLVNYSCATVTAS